MGVRDGLWAVGSVVVIGVLTGVMGLIGLTAGSGALSLTLSSAGRAVLSLVGLAVLMVFLARRGPWDWLVPLAGVGTLALLVNPLTWTAGSSAGGPLFGVPLTGSSVVGLVVDVVVWGAVTAGAAWLGLGSREEDDGR